MRIIILTLLVCLFSANVFSATVKSVTCHQCWPWSGKVDIGYVLESSANDPVFEVKFYGKAGEGESFLLSDLKGDGSAGIVLGSGSKMAVWDPSGTFPGTQLSDFKIALAAEEVTSQAKYIVLDLNAYTFSYASSTNAATVSVGSDSKKSQIWFRRIEPGTYQMSTGDDWSYFDPSWTSKGTETSHDVQLTKGFYIGIFEVTEAQFSKIDSETASESCAPKLRISYDQIRGSEIGATWPYKTDCRVDSDSFLGNLRSKTGGGVIIDLPTEGQWELACRSRGDGTFIGAGCWNDGSPYDSADGQTDNNLDKLAWYKMNSSNRAHEVGTKRPSLMGLYDMHGNAWEWCIDYFDSRYGLTTSKLAQTTVDPVGLFPTASSKNSRRCGAYGNLPVDCRISRRTSPGNGTTYADYGFRLALIQP
ncbi:SUMF1/EgtB/PvdO family nonheme iron enzyme [bacterium]|nr:SUMF1/EgtB/PvdO family nonheme iron enzyme [bacterium]